MSLQFDVITIFPEIIEAPLQRTILKRALDRDIIQVRTHQLRDWGQGPHRRIDDAPYGGGPGMVMMPEPIFQAVEAVKQRYPAAASRTVLLSPQGRRFDHATAVRLSLQDRLILICGRYEGVDERVRELLIDEDISIGDYVLTGGEVPALVIIDSVSRLVPGVVGESASVLEDSFANGMLQHPQYTRPASFRDAGVPEVLLSGKHAEIEEWRRRAAMERTRRWRPDLLQDRGQGAGQDSRGRT